MTFPRNKWKKNPTYNYHSFHMYICMYANASSCTYYFKRSGNFQTIPTTPIYISRIVLNSSTFTNIKVKTKCINNIIVYEQADFLGFWYSTDQLYERACGVKPWNIMQGQIWALLLFRVDLRYMYNGLCDIWMIFFFHSFLFVV